MSPQATHKKKKASVRVKWVDHFGGDLAESRLIEGENIVQDAAVSDESWSDRKKRDREKEKKLLLTMKYVSVDKNCTANRVLSSHSFLYYDTEKRNFLTRMTEISSQLPLE